MWPSVTNRGTLHSSPMPDFARTRLLLEKGLLENHWTGFSVAAFFRGTPHSFAGGNVPNPEASVCWLSAGKPVTSVGVLRLLEQKPELWPLPMEASLPELRGSYLGDLDLLSILTHRTGLRHADLDLTAPKATLFGILAGSTPEIFQLRPGQPAYDPRGGWWILHQWLERNAGMPWQVFLSREVLHPSGAGEMFFASADREADVPMDESKGGRWHPAPAVQSLGNLCGSAAALARFYHALLSGKILQADSFGKFCRRWREGEKDATFGHTLDFGLGVILDSNRYGASTVPYGFGTQSSDRTFGHGGARSSVAFADPEMNLAVAIWLNGQVPENKHQPRIRAILDLLRHELT
ncbi:MAG: class A beta-lactamase-related serine hydrolase [Verrucomicrobia bacterium]|nr:class A beta-lactamase-related serine hydrolase [Verrucomicrobiota bacterium]